MQDDRLIEKLAHQDREPIPERVVHAKVWGASGALAAPSAKATTYITVKLFDEVGHKTEADIPKFEGAE